MGLLGLCTVICTLCKGELFPLQNAIIINPNTYNGQQLGIGLNGQFKSIIHRYIDF